jgi:Uma2 family endonuclease
MGAVTATKYITEEEYFAAEEMSLERHEYYKGEVFAMAGASINHESIVGETHLAIGNHLRKKPCRVFLSNLKIKVKQNTLVTYPDLSIYCEEITTYKNRTDTVTNPTVLIEVLSPSTQKYDRGNKFMLYKELTSLKEYVLISSTEILVEHYLKRPDGEWQLSVYKQKDDLITIQSIDFTTAISVFYENADFNEA